MEIFLARLGVEGYWKVVKLGYVGFLKLKALVLKAFCNFYN